MASKKVETKDVAVQDSRVLAGPLKCQPAQIVDESIELTKIDGLPEEFLGGKFEHGFPPTVKFEKPGDFAGGEFVHMRAGVGPNNSRVYELALPDGTGDHLKVVVWGSTVLDRQFDSAYPPIQQGDKIGIIYLGDKETGRKQNPAKLFALKVIRG